MSYATFDNYYSMRIISKMTDLSHRIKILNFQRRKKQPKSRCVLMLMMMGFVNLNQIDPKQQQLATTTTIPTQKLCTRIKWKPTINFELVCCIVKSKEKTSFGISLKLRNRERERERMMGMWLHKRMKKKINTLLLDMLKFSIWIQRKLFPPSIHPYIHSFMLSLNICIHIHMYTCKSVLLYHGALQSPILFKVHA